MKKAILYFNLVLIGLSLPVPLYPQKFNFQAGDLTLIKKLADSEKEIEASGILPIDDQGEYFLVADDKNADLLIICRHGNAMSRVHFSNVLPGKWEGLARDNNGNYYAVSQYVENEGVRVVAFTLDENSLKNLASGSKLISVQTRQIWIKNILSGQMEGLAVKSGVKPSLFLGLREPCKSSSSEKERLVQIFSVDTNTFTNFPAEKTSSSTPFCLSSLEYVPQWKGFLVLTSTENGQNKFHGNKLYFLSETALEKPKNAAAASDKLQLIGELDYGMKAEGIAILPDAKGLTR